MIGRSKRAQRCLGHALIALLTFAMVGATVEAPQTKNLSAGLLQLSDAPNGWHEFNPGPAKTAGPGACGLPRNAQKPRRQAYTAIAKDKEAGPIIGERIELVGSARAAARVRDRHDLPLPCEWDDQGNSWRATAEPPLDVANENVVYLIENLVGTKGYNYETVIRCGGALVLLVYQTRVRDRSLLEQIAPVAIKRFDALNGVGSCPEAPGAELPVD